MSTTRRTIEWSVWPDVPKMATGAELLWKHPNESLIDQFTGWSTWFFTSLAQFTGCCWQNSFCQTNIFHFTIKLLDPTTEGHNRVCSKCMGRQSVDIDFPFYIMVKLLRTVCVVVLAAEPVHWLCKCNPVPHQNIKLLEKWNCGWIVEDALQRHETDMYRLDEISIWRKCLVSISRRVELC